MGALWGPNPFRLLNSGPARSSTQIKATTVPELVSVFASAAACEASSAFLDREEGRHSPHLSSHNHGGLQRG